MRSNVSDLALEVQIVTLRLQHERLLNQEHDIWNSAKGYHNFDLIKQAEFHLTEAAKHLTEFWKTGGERQ